MTLAEFDALWGTRHLETTVPVCRTFLGNQLKLAPEYDWYWRAAQMEHFRGQVALDLGDKTAAIGCFDKAVEWAAKADEAKREQLESQYWRGLATLDAALARGSLQASRAYGPATKWLEKAEYFDQAYQQAGALREQGRICRRKPLILGGNLDTAIAFLKHACELAPLHTTNLLYLADVYIVDRQPKAAREALKAVLDLEPLEDWQWEAARDKRLTGLWLNERFG